MFRVTLYERGRVCGVSESLDFVTALGVLDFMRATGNAAKLHEDSVNLRQLHNNPGIGFRVEEEATEGK